MTSVIPPDNSYAVHEPVSMTPAEYAGWRVVYLDGDPVPVVAWGVFHRTWRSLATGETVRDDGNVMDAVVVSTHNGPGAVHLSPAWNENFLCYLPPGASEADLTGTGPA